MGKRATKTWNLLCKLLLNELNSDVTRFTTHVQTCFATNKSAASCLNTDFWLDKITRRDLRHLLQNKYCLGPLKLSMQHCRFWFKKQDYSPFVPQLFATCNNLICCMTGLNVSGKTRNIPFFCPFYRAFTGTLLGCFSNRTGTSVDDGKERGEY